MNKYRVFKKPPFIGGYDYISVGDIVTIEQFLQNGIVGIKKENEDRIYYYPRNCIARYSIERRNDNDYWRKNKRD